MKLKTGDRVIVISGADKGKVGEIIQTMPKDNRVIVEGVNMITKHQKPNMRNNTGGIVHQEAPIHISNVMYYDKSKKSPSRVRYDVKDGRKVRVAVKSGNVID
mgnify:CR=1 FL=1